MSTYLLGTNVISDLIRNPHGAAARRIEQVGAKAVRTSIIGGPCRNSFLKP